VNNEEKIISLLESMHSKMGQMQEQLTHVQGQLTQIDGRLTHVEGQLIQIDGRLTHVEGQLTQIDGRLTHVEGQLIQIDGRLTHVEEQLIHVRESVIIIEIEHGRKLGALLDSTVLTKETLQKVDKLQQMVDNLEFGDEVISLVNVFEKTAAS
jgi:chromosome segregation ATPase